MKNRILSNEIDARELSTVKKDFKYVLTLNLILLGLMLGLYFWNRSTGQLDVWFSQVIKF